MAFLRVTDTKLLGLEKIVGNARVVHGLYTDDNHFEMICRRVPNFVNILVDNLSFCSNTHRSVLRDLKFQTDACFAVFVETF